MAGRRHKNDTEYYRTLETYKERMQSFNASTMKLREYVRVMLELDVTSKRNTAHIINKSIRRIEREIDAVKRLMH